MLFSVEQIVDWTGGRLVNEARLGARLADIRVGRPAPLADATASDIAFFFSREYESDLRTTKPGILITGEAFVKPLEAANLPLLDQTAIVACSDPYFSMACLSEKFAAENSTVCHSAPRTQVCIHQTAFVHSSVTLGAGVQIGAHCVIEEGAQVGAGSVLYPGCFVGPKVQIGMNCVLFPSVTLYEWTRLGDRVRIHAGAVLGADGFGYAPRREGNKVVAHQKIFHLGRVVVGDDVEIGANSCVDRGTMGDTKIGKGAKLDNVVHIGHNADVGEGTIICGGTCLAGRASTGKFVYVGGMSGITNQTHVGDAAQVGAMTLVTKDVPPGGTAVGNPQREHREHFRAHALLNRLCSERKNERAESSKTPDR